MLPMMCAVSVAKGVSQGPECAGGWVSLSSEKRAAEGLFLTRGLSGWQRACPLSRSLSRPGHRTPQIPPRAPPDLAEWEAREGRGGTIGTLASVPPARLCTALC